MPEFKSRERRKLSNAYVGKTCPYCQTPLKPGAEVVVCSECEMPHHADCWQDNNGCTTYGCNGKPIEAGRSKTGEGSGRRRNIESVSQTLESTSGGGPDRNKSWGFGRVYFAYMCSGIAGVIVGFVSESFIGLIAGVIVGFMAVFYILFRYRDN